MFRISCEAKHKWPKTEKRNLCLSSRLCSSSRNDAGFRHPPLLAGGRVSLPTGSSDASLDFQLVTSPLCNTDRTTVIRSPVVTVAQCSVTPLAVTADAGGVRIRNRPLNFGGFTIHDVWRKRRRSGSRETRVEPASLSLFPEPQPRPCPRPEPAQSCPVPSDSAALRVRASKERRKVEAKTSNRLLFLASKQSTAKGAWPAWPFIFVPRRFARCDCEPR